MGRREKNSVNDIMKKSRYALENKGVSVIGIEYQMITDRFHVDYECKECKFKGLFVFKGLGNINNFRCEKCKEALNNRVGSIEEINDFGVNYIDGNCDGSSDYYRSRLKRIWGRLKDSNRLSNELLDYKDFEGWSLSSGYKHWKKLKSTLKDNNEPYGIDNCYWGCDKSPKVIEKIEDNDTYVNRVRIMSIIGGESESIKESLEVISEAMIELDCSRFISKGSLEMFFEVLTEMKERSNELIGALDEIDIGRSRK